MSSEQTQFDVFLAHNSQDKSDIRLIAEKLRQRQLNPWLDEDEIPPGRWFQDSIQQAISNVKSAAVFIGLRGLGGFQAVELRSFISQCIEANIPVIPVLLPGVDKFPEHLLFLKQLNWVHFAQGINDIAALDKLVWGITGQRQGGNSSPQSSSDTSSPEQRDVTVTTPPIPRYILPIPKYAKQLLIRNRDDLNQLSAFFRYTTKIEKEKEATPIDIYQLISNMPGDGSCTSFALNGGQGTGKTAFLSVLYAALNSTAINRSQRRYPLFIDADDYTNVNDRRQSILQVIESLNNTIKVNQEYCRFVLMVDGLTGREKELSKTICQQLLFQLDLNVFDAIIWSIVDDFEEDLNQILKKNNILNPLTRIQIYPIKVNDLKIDYLKDFIFLYKRINGRNVEDVEKINICNDAEALAERLNSILPGDEIDQHILSLIYEKLNIEHYFDNANLATFLEKYCLEQLNKEGTTKTFERLSLLREAAWLAYRLIIETFYQGQVPRDLQVEPKERNTKFWSLVTQHSNIRDFLVAWYVIDLIRYRDSGSSAVGFSDNLNGDIVNRDLISYDFPQIVNRFMRYILSSHPNIGNEVVTNISRILRYFEKNQTKQLSQTVTVNLLYYLLGRCPSTGPRQEELLQRATQQVEKKLANATGNERIQLLTQYRTISISRMRLGKNSSKEFLSKLLRNNLLASIDRGYHRLYYGDAQTFKEDVPTCYLDNESASWLKSFEALKDHLDREVLSLSYNDDIDATNSNSGGLEDIDTDSDPEELSVQTQHYIFTLVSFVQSRIEEVSAQAETQRLYAKQVIKHLLNQKNLVLIPELRHYLGMMQIDLEQDNSYSSRWRFVLNLYRLKWEPRRGWLLRNLQPNFQVGRIESVADHSYATLLLASLLLPDNLEEAPNYKREDVIRKLIFHDIAEAYTGDFIFHLFNEEDKEEAKSKGQQALAYLRFKQTYGGLNNSLAIFNDSLDFSAAEGNRIDTDKYVPASNTSPPSDSAKVARDIDKLENLIQLFLYKDMYPEFIDDTGFQHFVDNLLKMHTEYVRCLAKDFIKWAELHQGNLLHWCDKFFDDQLLQKHERVIDVKNQREV